MKYCIGVEIGIKNITVGVVDKYGKLLRKDMVPTLKGRDYSEIVKDIAALITKVLNNEDIDLKNVKYIGIGCAGIHDNEAGVIVSNYQLNFSNIPIRAELQKYIKTPILVENDASCAALAESVAGAAEDIEYSVTIKIDSAIAGGIIIDNKIYSGYNSLGSEFGHMVIAYGGEQCHCGRKGCWENYASVSALIKQTKEAIKENSDSKMLEMIENDLSKIDEFTALDAARLGDEPAKKVFAQYVDYLAEGIANLINILMPEVIIIGGDISRLGDYIIKPLMNAVEGKMYSKEISLPEFKTAETGSAAVIIGAAMLGLYKER